MNERYLHLDGLRGLAALAVVFCHFVQLYLPAAFSRTAPDHFGESLISASPLNLIFNGNFAVAIFFVLSGFVLAAPFFNNRKPTWYLKAAIKRYPRLAIPALASTLLPCLIYIAFGSNFSATTEFSGYTKKEYFSGFDSITTAVWQGLIGTFLFAEQDYNRVLWTIRTELIGSFGVFALLPILGRYRARVIVYAALVVILKDSYLLGFVLGTLAADLVIGCRAVMNRTPSIIALTAGLYLGAFPYVGQDLLIWRPISSIPLNNIFTLSHIVGAFFCIIGLLGLPSLQRLLTARPCAFLGRISYSMYLIHFTIIGFLGSFIIINLSSLGYGTSLIVAMTFLLPVIIGASYVFTILVDEPSIRLSNYLSKALTHQVNALSPTS
ncbi:acyltransferase [Pseudomonas sp. B14(2017)]|uniref:acyltransferase family protein n=1 Tax=Pseudomonas sp. B14(2017) TaxID=1981745 RepID=UPI000A1E86DD|nr:acyltransferase [Pseudomonas sp. B14(2017)]